LLHLTGGEPSIYPDFPELCDLLSQDHYLSVNSNLTHPSINSFAERVHPSRVHYVNAGLHPTERSRHSGYSQFIRHADLLRKKGFPLFVSLVATPDVLARFEDKKREAFFPVSAFPKDKDDFAVVHDASSNFLRRKDVWKRITNNNVPQQLHRAGDGTMTEFPLRVVSTSPVDSKNSASVQYCDLLAGLTARHFSPLTEGDERDFMNEVIAAGLKELTYNGVRPATVFPERIPPKRLTGPDAVDRMTEIIFGEHNGPRDKS